MNARMLPFETLFAGGDDPWGYRSRWYEERKRNLLLAALSRRRYRTGFEAGCANGELSNALAARCEKLEVCDGAAKAVTLARRRLRHLPRVRVTRRVLPGEWPAGRFDLIVISEIAYFLEPAELPRFVTQCKHGLAEGGELVVCHWRGPIAGFALDAAKVHAAFRAALPGRRRFACRDADFLLDVWIQGAASIAAREGGGA